MQRNVERLIWRRGFLARKDRPQVERLLRHADELIRAYAADVLREADAEAAEWREFQRREDEALDAIDRPPDETCEWPAASASECPDPCDSNQLSDSETHALLGDGADPLAAWMAAPKGNIGVAFWLAEKAGESEEVRRDALRSREADVTNVGPLGGPAMHRRRTVAERENPSDCEPEARLAEPALSPDPDQWPAIIEFDLDAGDRDVPF